MLEFTEEKNGFLTATQLSKISGESYRTIDFYSGQGLIKVSARRGRMRLYNEREAIGRIRRIRRLQNRGYPLTLIKEDLDNNNS